MMARAARISGASHWRLQIAREKNDGTPRMQRELSRNTLAVLFLVGLITASFWILRPFLASVIWAAMIVVATWPLLRRLEARVGGRRSIAVALMTLAMILVFVLPFWMAIGTISDYARAGGDWPETLAKLKLPPPPDVIESLPFVGHSIADPWRQAAELAPAELAAKVRPYAGTIAKFLAAQAGGIGMLLVEFLMTIVISAVLYANGEAAAEKVMHFGQRLAGERGEHSVRLAAQAIRGVALGVVVTALVQSVLGGIGLAVAGVPLAGILTAVMLMFCLAQLGPTLVLLPACIYLYWVDAHAWALVLLVWTVFVGTLDNFLRPYLIKKGADLPLLLIFAGVIGGLLTMGMIGIFVGPVVLAVAYMLFEGWIAETPPAKS